MDIYDIWFMHGICVYIKDNYDNCNDKSGFKWHTRRTLGGGPKLIGSELGRLVSW